MAFNGDGQIEEDQLAKLKSRLGVEYPAKPWNTAATPDAVLHFADGIGDDNPLWSDEAYVRSTSIDSMVAPPTFLFSIFSGGFGAAGGGLPGVFGLWAKDVWEWDRWVKVGESLTATNKLVAVNEKSGTYSGRMIEQVIETAVKDSRGLIVARNWRHSMKVERSTARKKEKYLDTPKYRYTAEEIGTIEDAYAGEKERRRGGNPRYWEDVKEGEELSTLVKGPLTITSMVSFLMGWGSPLCKTDRIAHAYMRKHPGARIVDPDTNVPDLPESSHWDQGLAKRSGLPGGYDIGAQRVSWFAHLCTDWMGDSGFLRRLEVQLRRPNVVGDTTWCRGKLSRKYEENGEHLLDCELWGDNQRGERTTLGMATIRLPHR